MREITIETTLKSDTVISTCKRLNVSEMELWNVFFESGMEYMEHLKKRIKRKRIFDVQFKPIRNFNQIGKIHFPKLFETITYSPEFWKWWSSILWFVCRETEPQDMEELSYRLQFTNELIPHFVMKKIFSNHDKQKYECRQGVAHKPRATATKAKEEERTA